MPPKKAPTTNDLLQRILDSMDNVATNSSPVNNISSTLETINHAVQTIATNMISLNENISKIADSLPIINNINSSIADLNNKLAQSQGIQNPVLSTSLPSVLIPSTPPVIEISTSSTSSSDSDITNTPNEIPLIPLPSTSFDTQATNIKKSITQTWNKNISSYSHHSWQNVRNQNMANNYSIWIENTPIIVPKEFKIKSIIGEPIQQKEVRERNAKVNYATEIELLILRSDSHLEKMKNIDSEMRALISEKSSGQTKDILINMWSNEMKLKDENAIKKWCNNNQKWMDKYENESISSKDDPFFLTHKITPSVDNRVLPNRSRNPLPTNKKVIPPLMQPNFTFNSNIPSYNHNNMIPSRPNTHPINSPVNNNNHFHPHRHLNGYRNFNSPMNFSAPAHYQSHSYSNNNNPTINRSTNYPPFLPDSSASYNENFPPLNNSTYPYNHFLHMAPPPPPMN